MIAADSDPGLSCSSGECFYRANVIGHLTVRVTPLAGSGRRPGVRTLWMPFCDDHAHELRAGATLIDFDSGL